MHAFLDEDETMMSSERKLFKLIYENDLKEIREMKPHLRDLNYFYEFPELELDSRVTPLIVAAHLGKNDIVKIFLQNEHIDINLGSHDLQLTPLCVACSAGNYEVVETLISNGADVNKPDMLTRSPLSFCFTRLQEDTNVFENNLICMKMANALLQNGADIDFAIIKDKGKTLLMDYCSVDTDMNIREKEANFKVIKFLLEHGADPSRKSKKGKTALDYCKRHPFKDDIQRMLLNTHQTYFHHKMKGLIPISEVYRVKKFKMFNTEEGPAKVCCNIFGLW